MKNHSLALATVVIIAFILAAVSIVKINPAAAQSIATSSDALTTTPSTDTATSAPAASTTVPAASQTPAPAATQLTSLTLVHVIGTKYIDYFTDGSTTIAVPGDPKIDANFNKPDAPIPTHPGMTWAHSTGQDLYDTPSGDLDIGDYALVNGTFSVHYAASTYTDATSTSQWPDRIVSGLTKDPVTGVAAQTTQPATTETAPTTTNDSTSSPAPATSTSGSVLGASTSSSNTTTPATDTSTTSAQAPLPESTTTSTTTP